jgi:hypothetical protein
MVHQTTNQALPEKIAHPKRRDIFFHFFKTGNLVSSLIKDRRVSVGRKVGFFIAIAALIAILLFPDILDETVLSFALPLVGTILGIPIDAGFDWVAFALVAVSLLKIFPKEIVGEHYKRIFHEG